MSAPLPAERHLRQRWAEELLDRLTPAMSALAFLLLLVVLGQQLARPGSGLGTVLSALGWLLWAVFAAELLVRLALAPDKDGFWRRNWWQVVFLVLPFLRVLRLVRAVRLVRTGRVLSSAVRSARSAESVLSTRVGWLATVSAITVLGSSELLYGRGDYARFGDALHAAALATIIGQPLGLSDGFARVLEVVLAAFSVIVFATLAGSIGGYFLETRHGGGREAVEPGGPDPRGTGRRAFLRSGDKRP